MEYLIQIKDDQTAKDFEAWCEKNGYEPSTLFSKVICDAVCDKRRNDAEEAKPVPEAVDESVIEVIKK